MMPRGWSKAPVLDGWVQIFSGSRPKSDNDLAVAPKKQWPPRQVRRSSVCWENRSVGESNPHSTTRKFRRSSPGHREPLASRDPPGNSGPVDNSSVVQRHARHSIREVLRFVRGMEISTVPNDRNSADVTQMDPPVHSGSARGEFGAMGSQTPRQCRRWMEKVERQQRAVTTSGEMWTT